MIRFWQTLLLIFGGGFMIVPSDIVLTIFGVAFMGLGLGMALGGLLGYKD